MDQEAGKANAETDLCLSSQLTPPPWPGQSQSPKEDTKAVAEETGGETMCL